MGNRKGKPGLKQGQSQPNQCFDRKHDDQANGQKHQEILLRIHPENLEASYTLPRNS